MARGRVVSPAVLVVPVGEPLVELCSPGLAVRAATMTAAGGEACPSGLSRGGEGGRNVQGHGDYGQVSGHATVLCSGYSRRFRKSVDPPLTLS
jgi:hypothetical protein